jgi:hypothetical protein
MTTLHHYSSTIVFMLAALLGCDHDPVTMRQEDIHEPIVCAGLLGLKCPEGLVCVDAGADDCDPENGGADCPGVCQPQDPVGCGGIAGFDCPEGQPCIDDGADDCDPDEGGADCPGICWPPPVSHCGGLVGIECPMGQVCVDDPTDDCDPADGGADCIGICEPLVLEATPVEPQRRRRAG